MLSNRASVHDNHICLFFSLTLRHSTLEKKGFHDFTIRSIHLTPISFNHERMAFQPIFHILRVWCMMARGWRLLLYVNTDTLENIKEIIQSFTIIGKNTACRKQRTERFGNRTAEEESGRKSCSKHEKWSISESRESCSKKSLKNSIYLSFEVSEEIRSLQQTQPIHIKYVLNSLRIIRNRKRHHQQHSSFLRRKVSWRN